MLGASMATYLRVTNFLLGASMAKYLRVTNFPGEIPAKELERKKKFQGQSIMNFSFVSFH